MSQINELENIFDDNCILTASYSSDSSRSARSNSKYCYLGRRIPNRRSTIHHLPVTRHAHGTLCAIDSVASSTVTYTDNNLSKGVPTYYGSRRELRGRPRASFSNKGRYSASRQNAMAAGMENSLCQSRPIRTPAGGKLRHHLDQQLRTIGFRPVRGKHTLDSNERLGQRDVQNKRTRCVSTDSPWRETTTSARRRMTARKNMFISAVDTIVVTPNNPAPLSTPFSAPTRCRTIPYAELPHRQSSHGGSATIYTETGLEGMAF